MNKVYALLDEVPVTTTSDCEFDEIVDVIDPVAGVFATAKVIGTKLGVKGDRQVLEIIDGGTSTARVSGNV